MSIMSDPLIFSSNTTPSVAVSDTVCTNRQYKDRFKIEYNGRKFYVITPKNEKHPVLEHNLAPELRNITEDLITNCFKDTFLRLGKVKNEYVIEFRKEPLTAKALPYMFGAAAAGPLGGAVVGLCVTGGPAGWGLGAVIGTGVALAGVVATVATTVVLDANDVNQQPKIQS